MFCLCKLLFSTGTCESFLRSFSMHSQKEKAIQNKPKEKKNDKGQKEV